MAGAAFNSVAKPTKNKFSKIFNFSLAATRAACDRCSMSKQKKTKTAAAAPEAPHQFEAGNFGPTTKPLCKHCGLSEIASTHGWKGDPQTLERAAAPEAPQPMELERQRDELHRLWDASAAEARRNKARAEQLAEAMKSVLFVARGAADENNRCKICELAQTALEQFKKGAR
jgi:hypothetical protein